MGTGAVFSIEGDAPSSPPYMPSPQFKLLNTPPLLHEGLPENAELWLVRIQDSHLRADEFKGKRVKLALNSLDGKMGCFESSKGSQFEILDLHDVFGVQPFAFLPKGDSSLEVCKVSRQVAIVQSLDPSDLSKPSPNKDRHAFSEADGGTATLNKREESHAGSASLSMGIGGVSTVESLQDDDERISTGKVRKSAKKSKRDQLNSELDLSSPVGHSHKNVDVQEHTSSKEKSRKHRKIKEVQSK